MKKLTQTLFIVSFCLSAMAQQPNAKSNKQISSISDLVAKLKKKLPQDAQAFRIQSIKPACIVDSIIYKSLYSSSASMVVTGKEEYGYNAQYNIFIKKKYNWSSFSPGWNNSYKTNLIYDAHDNLLNELTLVASNQGTSTIWNNSGKSTYTYDNQNNQTSSTDQYWNSQTNAWKTNSINTYTYNSNNLITQEIYQSLSSSTSSIMNTYKYVYTYDIFNNPFLILGYEWDSTTNTWENIEKYDFISSGNKITSYLSYEWDATINSWVNSFKSNMTYDAYGNQTSQTFQSWDTVTSSWENEVKFTSTYDSNHNILSETDQTWNTSTNVWENDSQTLHTYNNNNYKTQQIQSSWKSSTYSWQNTSEADTYYNCHSVGLAEERPNASKLLIYPNPAQSELHIKSDKEFNQVSILNVSGQLVFESNATELLNISSLVKGIYFIQLLDKNKTVLQTQKFVKE